MVYAAFEETSRDERFDAVLDRLFVHAGELPVSGHLVEPWSSMSSPVPPRRLSMVFLSPNPRPMSFWRPATNETMASPSGWGSYGCCSSSCSVPDFRSVLPPVSVFVSPRRRVERLLRRSGLATVCR